MGAILGPRDGNGNEKKNPPNERGWEMRPFASSSFADSEHECLPTPLLSQDGWEMRPCWDGAGVGYLRFSKNGEY